MRHLGSSLSLFATLLLTAPGSSQSALDGCTPAAVDHVAIAVGSLDRAQLTYEELGFRLKPGRLHANGLRNAFAKFRAGSYLELISPERGAVDAQTEYYAAQLHAGEGGAALALRADSLGALGRRLEAAAIPVRIQTYGSAFTTLGFSDAELRWMFLIGYLDPVIDPPELLSHPNTATGIETIWLTEQALATLSNLGDALCLPAIGRASEAGGFAPVAGVTVRVRSVEAARRILRAAGLDVPIRSDARGRSVIVPPSRAHGIFIEFMEPDAASALEPAA